MGFLICDWTLIERKKNREKKLDENYLFFFDKVNKTVCKNGKFTLFTKFISHIWLTVIFNFISHYKSRHFAIWFAKRISCSFSNRIIWRITGARWNISNDRRQCMKEKMKKKFAEVSVSSSNVSKNILFSIFFPSNSIQIHFRMSIFRKYLLSKHCVSFCKLGDSTQNFIWALGSANKIRIYLYICIWIEWMKIPFSILLHTLTSYTQPLQLNE